MSDFGSLLPSGDEDDYVGLNETVQAADEENDSGHPWLDKPVVLFLASHLTCICIDFVHCFLCVLLGRETRFTHAHGSVHPPTHTHAYTHMHTYSEGIRVFFSDNLLVPI